MHIRRCRRPAVWAGVSLILSFALLIVALAGCGGSGKPPPTPTKTPKPPATNTQLPLTHTATPRPTSTPLPTTTPLPTQPPIPVVTATPTVLATPTPAANLSPLTGLSVSDPARLDRRPLAIKISNAPAIVRPQAGLDKADIVFEHMAEAELTRFTAIYLSQDADKVGSVRSARLIDLEIPAMFKSLFAFSGASGGVKQEIKASDFAERVISPDPGFNDPCFKRIPSEGKAYEHTLFTDTPALWKLATERKVNQRQELAGWTFAADPPAGGESARSIEVVYRDGIASAEYQYDAGRAAYLRSVLREPHIDEVTGQQLSAKNVIVLYAHHVETDIVEDMTGSKPYYSIQIQVWGQGAAKILRDGQVWDVTWTRPGREDMIQFQDAAGKPLPLKPGNTWIQLVPLKFPITVKP